MSTLLHRLGVWAIDYIDAGLVHTRSILTWTVPPAFSEGDPGKPTIVLIPGVYERWSFLRPIAERLNAAGYPVSVVHGLGYNLRPIVETSERLVRALSRVSANPAGRLIVAHSKGGLVGKHMLVSSTDELHLLGLVAVCTPFAGSRYARYVLGQTLRAFIPTHETIVSLGSNSSVNARIVSIFGGFDPHVPDGSVLVGATNVKLPVDGHFRILRQRETLDAVADAVDLLVRSSEASAVLGSVAAEGAGARTGGQTA
ncbi:esterase/lipase family protein [Mycetocola sp.]|uniref:esterase/lipase family protein n=1 Tax=Mycetocola sp. TaxID=1871042 RepID=UPI00398A4125